MTQEYMPTDDAITVRLLRRDGSEIGSGKSVEEIVERHRADLKCAHLGYANLSGANLEFAYLVGTDLRGADLRGANIRGAKTDLQEQDETLSGVAEHRKERES